MALLRSPAGFGKTTLLSQWWETLRQDTQTRAAWLSLDEDDRDAVVFSADMVSALENAGLQLGDLPRMARGENRVPPEGVFLKAIDEAVEREPCDRIILILEDYHLAGSHAVDRLVEKFIRHVPAKFHLVISSRTRPGFPLSKLRAFGRLLEIDEADLKFTEAEVDRFFGPGVAPDQVKDLNHRTQGWPVALQLARLWLKRTADPGALSHFSGSVQAMAAYLADQIVADLPEDDRMFLIATSVVERINGDLADALTGLEDGWDRLRALHEMGVPLIPLNPEQTWFRYHPTLAEYLQGQLRRQGERAVTALHRKASDWYSNHCATLLAVRHAVLAGAVEHAADLADEVSWVRRILGGKIQEVIRLRDILPFDEIEKRPRLCTAIAYLLMKEGNIEDGNRLYGHAETLARALLDNMKPAVATGLRTDLDLVGALDAVYRDVKPSADLVRTTERLLQDATAADFAYRGLLNNILALLYYRRGELISARASALNSYDEFSRSGMRYGSSFLLIHLAMFSITQGRLDEAREYLAKGKAEIIRYLGNEEGLRLRFAVFEAEIAYERNELERANDLIFEALREIEHSEGWVELYASAYRTMAFVAYAERGLKAALDVLTAGFRVAERFDYQRLSLNLSLKKAWLLLRDGKTAEARAVVQEIGLEDVIASGPEGPLSWREREEGTVTLAWLALAEGNAVRADKSLEDVEQRCLEGEHRRRLIQIRILRAFAALEMDDLVAAAQFLKLAISDAREGRFIRMFLDFGEPMRVLLKTAVDHMGVATIPEAVFDWIAEIVAAFEGEDRAGDTDLSALILTDRERDILTELKVGGSNKVIARRLDMTDNAVKFHLRNLYRKLGVHSRRMAVAVAEKRGL